MTETYWEGIYYEWHLLPNDMLGNEMSLVELTEDGKLLS